MSEIISTLRDTATIKLSVSQHGETKAHLYFTLEKGTLQDFSLFTGDIEVTVHLLDVKECAKSE